jgi:hypothetical protein
LGAQPVTDGVLLLSLLQYAITQVQEFGLPHLSHLQTGEHCKMDCVLVSYTSLMAVNNIIYHLNKCCSISDPLLEKGSALEQDLYWISVAPGETVPFSFEGRGEWALV